jgi:hypothetical protein
MKLVTSLPRTDSLLAMRSTPCARQQVKLFVRDLLEQVWSNRLPAAQHSVVDVQDELTADALLLRQRERGVTAANVGRPDPSPATGVRRKN